MTSKVRIRAPSHVHLGNFDLNGEYGRLFGTIGFTLEEPYLEVEVEVGDKFEICGTYEDIVENVVNKCCKVFNINKTFNVKIIRNFKRGVGLGLTTALTLSIVYSIARILNLDIDVVEYAPRFDRGLVSALGVYSFKYGGVIIDAGYRIDKFGKVPPLVYRGEVPRDWYFVVAIPRKIPEKVVEVKRREVEILRKLPKMSEEVVGKLCRIVLVKLIPSIEERDIETFGQAITEFNKITGTYWSFIQGGIYCSKEVERGIQIMLEEGCTGAAQSCWGPTFYGVADSYKTCERIKSRLIEELEIEEVYITNINNTGAKIIEKS